MADNLVITSSFSGAQLDEAYQKMLIKLTEEMTVKQVLAFIAQLSGTTVILYTQAESYIFCSDDNSITRNTIKVLQDNLRTPEKLLSFFGNERSSHCPTQYAGIYLDCYDNTVSTSALSADLVSGGKIIGTLCLLDVDRESFTEQAETLHLFSRILTAKIEASYLLSPERAEVVNIDVNSGAKWLRKIKGDQFQNFYIAATDAKEISSAEVEIIKQNIEQNGLLSRLVMHDPYLTILFNLRDNEEVLVMRTLLEQLCSDFGVSFGLSCRFRSTERIQNGYQQALDALRTSEYLGKTNRLCDFEFLCANVFLFELNRTGDLDCYRNEALDRLIEYDAINGTKYFETLKAFIACGGSKQKASQELYIHRNSLTYRLNFIEDLLDVSLDDVAVQTKLWFDIKIRETLDTGESGVSTGQKRIKTAYHIDEGNRFG